MGILTRFESRLGLTRGDVTVALFLSATAFVGFVHTTFFANPETERQQRELYALIERHDSILASEHAARLVTLEQSIAAPDTAVADWKPVSAEESHRDEIEEKARDPAGGRRKLTGPIDINTASKEDLELLPGVGEKTAERIIEHRAAKPFARPEDIMQVKGIGEKKFEKMRQWVAVR